MSGENRNEFANVSSKDLEPVPGSNKMRPSVPRQGDKVYIDYLQEDPEIPSQKLFLYSYVRTKDKINGEHTYGIKIRGCASTIEDLDKRADFIIGFDNKSNLFRGEVGKWLPICPNPADVGDQMYQNDLLNDIMKGKKENELKAKRVFEERKQEMIEKAIEDGTPEGQSKLADMNNHPKVIEMRINTFKEEIKTCQKNEEELHKLLREEKRKMDEFTYDEIQVAEKQVNEWSKAIENSENPQKMAMELVDEFGADAITVVNKLNSK